MFKFWPIHHRERIVFGVGKIHFAYELRCWLGTWTVYRLEPTMWYKTWQRTERSRENMRGSMGDKRLWLRASTGKWHEWDYGDRRLSQQHFASRVDAYEYINEDAQTRLAEIAWARLSEEEN